METTIIKGPSASIPIYRQCLELCRGRSFDNVELTARAGLFECLVESGAWEAALEASGGLLASLVARDDMMNLVDTRTTLAMLLCKLGREEEALPIVEWALEKGRQMSLPFLFCSVLLSAAMVYRSLRPLAVRAVLEDLRRLLDPSFAVYGVFRLPELLRNAHRHGSAEFSQGLTLWIEPRVPTLVCARGYGDALLAEAEGNAWEAASGFARAAAGWHDFGVPYEEAQALLGQGAASATLGQDRRGGEATDEGARDLRTVSGRSRPRKRPKRSCRIALCTREVRGSIHVRPPPLSSEILR